MKSSAVATKSSKKARVSSKDALLKQADIQAWAEFLYKQYKKNKALATTEQKA